VSGGVVAAESRLTAMIRFGVAIFWRSIWRAVVLQVTHEIV